MEENAQEQCINEEEVTPRKTITESRGHIDRLYTCYRACTGLTDPEKQIKALVDAARFILEVNTQAYGPKDNINLELESALEPFKNYGEKI